MNYILSKKYRKSLLTSLFIVFCSILHGQDANKSLNLKLISVNRIWSNNNHNAFTSLVVYNNKLYCSFREGSGHNSKDGVVRVLSSNNASDWKQSGKLSIPRNDLRDPKLSLNNENQLVLIAMSRLKEDGVDKHKTYTYYLGSNGWSKASLSETGENTWKWGVNRMGNAIYSIAYSGKDKKGTLYKSNNGQQWSIVKNNLFPNIKDFPNETAFLELQNNTAICLLRTNNGNKKALLGRSKSPYQNWQWTSLDKQIGGPSIIQLPNGEVYACVRLYNKVRTSICKIDLENNKLIEVLTLPSGYDSSYGGMAIFNDYLYVSYYSNHNSPKGKSDIYIAKIKY